VVAAAVEAAGGEVREHAAPRAQELWRWARDRAREQGLELDPDAAKALVAVAGPRQQRIAREVERLALLAYPDGRLTVEQVTRLAAGDVTAQAYDLADAVVAGDSVTTLRLAERVEAADARPGQLLYPLMRRLREVQRAAQLIDAGRSERDAAGELKLPPWLARRVVGQARRADRDALERAICALADLEIELRGGGERDLDEQTALTLALARAAG
jgi:DNA polymerase-3 subunit delta